MILSEFLKGRDVKINAVSNYISRNPDKFEGHIKREGKNTILDDEAVRILEEKYPYPKPITIFNGVPEEEHMKVLEDLLQAKSAIIMLQNELTDQKLINAQNEANMMLLEDKKEYLEQRMQEREQEQQNLKKELSEQEQENRKMKEEIERLRNRKLFDRIFNK